MASYGGKREGAGRKRNEESRKYKIQAYVTDGEVSKLVAWAKKNDKRWLLDQIFGKAPQRMELTGKDGENIIIQLSKEATEKYGTDAFSGPSHQ